MSIQKTFRMIEYKILSIDHNNNHKNKLLSQITIHSYLMIEMIINILWCRDKVKWIEMLISIPTETLVDRIIVTVYLIIRKIISMSLDLLHMEEKIWVEDLCFKIMSKCK